MVVAASACAARVAFVAPAGAGAPAPEADLAWTAASALCRTTSSYRAELGLTGHVGDRRLRGLASARLFAAVTASGDVGLEASVSGQLVFLLGGSSDRAILLLRDPNRIVEARPEAILEALIGVGLSPGRLLAIFGGCVSVEPSVDRAVRHGAILEVVTADATVFLEREGAAWRTRAARFGGVWIEYLGYEGSRPARIWVRAQTKTGRTVSLTLAVRHVVTNTAIASSVFHVVVPEGAVRLSLEELEQAGLLAEDEPGR